jgi:hypothetical protein
MSKGSTQRPFSVSNEEYSNRWDAIFGRDNEKENKEKALESDRPNTARDNRSIDNPEGQAGQTKDA